MNRRATLGLIAGAPLMTAPPAAAHSPADDRAAVQAWCERCVTAWAAGDGPAMYAGAAEDLEWINIVGMHWRGKADVVEAHERYLTTMFRGVPMNLREIETLRPIGRDGVVAVVRWAVGQFTTPTGHVIPPSEDRMTLVFVRDAGGLRLLHGANVQIDPVAAASDPIRRNADAE